MAEKQRAVLWYRAMLKRSHSNISTVPVLPEAMQDHTGTRAAKSGGGAVGCPDKFDDCAFAVWARYRAPQHCGFSCVDIAPLAAHADCPFLDSGLGCDTAVLLLQCAW